MNKEKSAAKPIKTVVFMMSATMISKVLGLIRNMVQTGIYGTSMEADAFTQAYNIPYNFFDIILSAAILGCFIPVYNSFKQDDIGREKADRFACVFFNTIFLITGILAFLGIVFAEPIISFMGAELDIATQKLAVKLLRIMFPMIIFTGTAFTLVGILQSKGKYILPAFMSAISNAGIIIYLLFFDGMLGDNGIYGLAIAYLVSWLIQFATLVIPLIRSGFKFKLILDFKNPELRQTLKMTPPIMIGSWLMAFISLSGLYFTPYVGNVTVFDRAFSTYILIGGILIHSLCNYVFPILSKLSVHGNDEEFKSIVRTGLTVACTIIIPFMFLVYILSGEGIAVLYMRGEFSPEAAYDTARMLRCMTIALPAFAVMEILNRVFFSRNLSKVPMIASLCGIAVNIITAAILIQIPNVTSEVIGIAVAAAQILSAVMLLIFLHRKIKGVFNKTFVINIIKILIAGIVSFVSIWITYNLIGNNPYNSNEIRNLIVMIIIFVVGAIIYLGGLFLMRAKIKHEG